MSRKLGQLEAAALAYVQMRSVRTAKTGDLAAAVLLIFADFRGYHRAWIERQPIIGHWRIQYLTHRLSDGIRCRIAIPEIRVHRIGRR